ncbi:MsnO8 family LLM class oxidoreductase [Streptococcus ruminantium]|uniref:MsnO8 family LLM class oxidoreductase n=1 Tax=Streptococcus ruminantium TaxID=1917441 RepID=UPI0012DE85E2|nr:MsnO8 family LLM class oxidoreductase [Streptococcus ruminantium]
MKISLLDYGLLDEGRTHHQAWQDSLALIQAAERLGYHRFWLAEHHNVQALSIGSPEVVIPYLASQTQRIHLGSGGIMGLHYSPYKIAELAASLENLFPGRVDIGLGNSIGTPLVKQHMKSLFQPNQFEEWLQQFTGYLTGQDDSIGVSPRLSIYPEVFTLGMGGRSLSFSARLGLGYVFGSFPYIDHDPVEQAGRLSQVYRQNFQPSNVMKRPYFALALFVVIAPTSQEAEDLAKSLDIWMLGKREFNEFSHFPSLKTYQSYPLTEEDRKKIAQHRSRMIVGNPVEVKTQVDRLIAASQPDEILFIPLLAGIDNRLKAIELLADSIESE